MTILEDLEMMRRAERAPVKNVKRDSLSQARRQSLAGGGRRTSNPRRQSVVPDLSQRRRMSMGYDNFLGAFAQPEEPKADVLADPILKATKEQMDEATLKQEQQKARYRQKVKKYYLRTMGQRISN